MRAPKIAVENEKSVFSGGASHLHLAKASLAPRSRPGFPYFELLEVLPMQKISAFIALTLFKPSNFRGINLTGTSSFQYWGRKTGAPTK